MNAPSQIQRWLSEASLPPSLPRTLSAEGFWSMPYGKSTLTLAVANNAESFVLFAPLLSVAGGTERTLASFYHRLLSIQLHGELPGGMTFGMDIDDTLVSIIGQYSFGSLSSASFDKLIHDVAASAEQLREQLTEIFMGLSQNEEKAPTDDSEQSSPEYPPSSGATESDQELLRARMGYFIRI